MNVPGKGYGVSEVRKKVALRVGLMVLACILPLVSRAADGPLNQDDVRLLLIGGAASQKMVALIKERGIGFTMTADLAKQFRDDGADDAVIDALEKAVAKPAPAVSPNQAAGEAHPVTSPPTAAPSASGAGNASSGGPVLVRPAASGGAASNPAAASSTEPPAPARSSAGGPVLIRHDNSGETETSAPAASNASTPTQTGSASGSKAASVDDRIKDTLAEADAKPTEATGSSSAAKPGAATKPNLTDPSPEQAQQIIQEFARKEKLFKEARDNYTYHQINKVETLGGENQITGMWQQEWDIVYDDAGKRIEKVTYAPPDSLKDLIMTEQDYDALRRIAPFVLTSDDLPQYDVKYLGHVQVDQLTCYVFSVRPKEIVKGHQYFQGVVWVDDRDLQIVKAEGKNVPELLHTKNGENLFPRFTTYREQIDGKYWFPTFTIADQNLYFSGGPPVHIKEVVRYTEYKQFRSAATIKMIGAVDGKDQNQQQATPPKKPDQKPQE